MPNKFIQRYIEELLDKRRVAEYNLERAEKRLKQDQEDKINQENTLDVIDEALVVLGYKGDEVE